VVIHRHSKFIDLHEPGCDGPAFYSLYMIDGYPSRHIDDILLLDGTKPEVGKPIRCGTCGKHWTNLEISGILVVDSFFM